MSFNNNVSNTDRDTLLYIPHLNLNPETPIHIPNLVISSEEEPSVSPTIIPIIVPGKEEPSVTPIITPIIVPEGSLLPGTPLTCTIVKPTKKENIFLLGSAIEIIVILIIIIMIFVVIGLVNKNAKIPQNV